MKLIRGRRPCLVERWEDVWVADLLPGDIVLVGSPPREAEVLTHRHIEPAGGWFEVVLTSESASALEPMKGQYHQSQWFQVKRVVEVE